MRRHVLPGILCMAFTLASTASAQGPAPAGPELRVNVNTLGVQDGPAAVMQPDGGFLVVWNDSLGDGSNFAVQARRYDAAGVGGPVFRVNTYTTGIQEMADHVRSVAADARGRVVVVWSSAGQDGSGTGVFGRRLDAAGAPLGPEFQVNTFTTGDQNGAAVSVGADGRFVVAWHSMGQDGHLLGVFARAFDAAGDALGGEVQVNTYTSSGQLTPDVALRPDGSFVVVWMSAQDGSGNSVHGRAFAAAGAPLGPEFQLNATTALGQTFPVVAATGGEGFVTAWESDEQDGSDDGIYARRFSGPGLPAGPELQVNTFTTTRQSFPSIAADASGRFTITWESLLQDGSVFGVYGQRFQADGARRGSEFQVPTTTADNQVAPRAALDAVGNFLVVWEGPDGSSTGSFAQRYGGLRPAGLSLRDGGNDVLEVPDDFGLTTSWANNSGASQAFSGQAASFTAPPGLVPIVGSTTAAYGTVPDGTTRACLGPCLSGALQGQRPPGHVDVVYSERIVPDTQGQQKRWVLHVGGSFSDVARTSGFYRFIETLLHHGVTGGCGPNAYCPASSTTREQMAVFVLAAREGSSYAPPACVPPNVFADVPETSVFCRWIEELSRRGVVGGCGGGNYCPSDAVTREQMAVFVLRTLDPTLDPPACVPPNLFADVPETSVFCRWIEELANRQIVAGCGGGNYCPASPVTREQMGVFLSVTFGLALYGV